MLAFGNEVKQFVKYEENCSAVMNESRIEFLIYFLLNEDGEGDERVSKSIIFLFFFLKRWELEFFSWKIYTQKVMRRRTFDIILAKWFFCEEVFRHHILGKNKQSYHYVLSFNLITTLLEKTKTLEKCIGISSIQKNRNSRFPS